MLHPGLEASSQGPWAAKTCVASPALDMHLSRVRETLHCSQIQSANTALSAFV